MPTTPNITLTATLLDYSGNTIGTTAQPAWLRIALCGFGATLPVIAGTGNLTKISSWFLDIPFTGSLLTTLLWGNDQITPSGTYYAISVLDTNKNVVQTGIYQFTGGPKTVDLSSAPQIVQPPTPHIFGLVQNQLSGTVPGNSFTIPTPILGTILAFFYRGVFYPAQGNYSVAGQIVTTTFACTAEPYAIYVQALG